MGPRGGTGASGPLAWWEGGQESVIAEFLSHLLPKTNWNELGVLSSVSKAVIG